jgi:hypothetical protein
MSDLLSGELASLTVLCGFSLTADAFVTVTMQTDERLYASLRQCVTERYEAGRLFCITAELLFLCHCALSSSHCGQWLSFIVLSLFFTLEEHNHNKAAPYECLDAIPWLCARRLCHGRVSEHCAMAMCLNAVPWPCVRPLCHGCVLECCAMAVCLNAVPWQCA